MKKRLSTILALVLTLCLLFGGCEFFKTDERERELVDYTTVKYVRPDYDKLISDIKECGEKLKNGKYGNNKDKLYEDMEAIVDGYYYKLLTMSEVAFINYAQDITSSEARDEYYDIYEQSQVIYTYLEELYSICAQSKHAKFLEESFLGEGFLDSYEGDYSVPDELVELFSRETELIKSYSEAMADLTVDYGGRSYTYDEMIGIPDDFVYFEVLDAFCEKYNSILGKIYVELVGVRQDIAELCGYDSYADYAYENLLGREYAPADADKYISGVKKYAVPIYKKYFDDSQDNQLGIRSISPEKVISGTQTIVNKLSDELSRIYSEMLEKNLYTVGCYDTMYYGSFQTYLNDFESPYLFVNGSGTSTDALTMLHEFGHFSSAYFNYGSTGSNDECEVASQALELIGSRYIGEILGSKEAEAIKGYELFYILSSVTECAAWTEFENLAYADDTLTLEECNEYYEQCSLDFGLTNEEGEGSDVRAWVLINHLFEQPYYTIGYSVSADVAVQIYELECENEGKGVEKYLELIKLAQNYDFFGNLKTVKLESPFADGRAEKFAAVIDGELSRVFG